MGVGGAREEERRCHRSPHRWWDKSLRGSGALASQTKEPSEELPVPTIPTGASHPLSTYQAGPLLLLFGPSQPTAVTVSSQMWALWKAWPITVAGTHCTGQATQHPPSPVTPWTRPAQGPLRGRQSSPCLEMTTQGHLCWMNAKSKLLGPRGGSHCRGEWEWERQGPPFLALWPWDVHYLPELCLIQVSEPKGRLRAVGDALAL